MMRLKRRRPWLLVAALGTWLLGAPSTHAGLTITPTFTTGFDSAFGANAPAAKAAWIAAAGVFEANFTDNININISVDGVSGTSVFGQSNLTVLRSSYANLHNLMIADSKTADDATALGAGGSLSATDPTGGTGNWWVSRAEAKAIGLIASDSSNDGTTRFGAGFNWTFSGPVAAGTYDFQGVAAHEISEVMGRIGLSGGTIGSFTNSYSLIDLFSYTGANARSMGNGAGSFSINNGNTLLKAFNNASQNGLDTRDWAGGTNDAFNQYSSGSVTNPVSAVDLRLMDVLGYDFKTQSIASPEPATLVSALGGACLMVVAYRRRSR